MDLVEIAYIDHRKVLDSIGNAYNEARSISACRIDGSRKKLLRYKTSSCFMQSGSQSRPKRMITSLSSSLIMAWSTCQPEIRCGSTTEPMAGYRWQWGWWRYALRWRSWRSGRYMRTSVCAWKVLFGDAELFEGLVWGSWVVRMELLLGASALIRLCQSKVYLKVFLPPWPV